MTFDFPTEILEEGSVRFLAPRLEAFKKAAWEYAPSKAPVFYNPVMELNRDLAVLAVQTYQKKLNREIVVCEPLTGCGVRGIRFAREVTGVQTVVLDDMNPVAANLARHNVELNKLSNRVLVFDEDANLLLSRYGAPQKRFDYIDIDPFGTPVAYTDSALRSLRDSGLIALTATDMAPLCGVYSQVSFRKYGGRSLRTEYCHELAVRLLAGSLVSTAARYDIGVRFLFSHSTAHYVRVYAIASHGARKADESLGKMGYVLHCFNCLHRETYQGSFAGFPSRCSECGSQLKTAGPLWLGKIFESEFVSSVRHEVAGRGLRNEREILKLLSLIEEECDGTATYHVINRICDKLSLPVPPLRGVVDEIRRTGFQAFLTHFNRMGFRTDASSSVVTEIIRNYEKRESHR